MQDKALKTGRPREYDRDTLSSLMLEWAQLNDSMNLNQFSAKYLVPPPTVMQWARDDKYFSTVYSTVKAILASRREERLNSGELHARAYERNATVYDLYMRDELRNQIEFEAKINTEVAVSEVEAQKYDQIMSLLASRQVKRPPAIQEIENNDD